MTREVLAELLRALAEKRTVVLVTELTTGAGRLLDPFDATAGGDAELLAAARKAASLDRSERLERPGGDLFLRVFNPPVRVVLVGAVHVSQPLARMAQLAGYDVVVVDPRRSFATPERFQGIQLENAWPDEVFPRLRLDHRSAVVALTHDPKIDDPALEAALRSPAFYIGALGSKKTQAARRERLAALGFDEAAIARIHGPVGLPLGAATPGEIAVSVLSELVGCLHQAPALSPA